MGLNVCINEPIDELTHINVRHIFAETCVSLELNLVSLWCVDGPLPVGVAGDAESSFLSWGMEKRFVIPLSLTHISNILRFPFRVLDVTPAGRFKF